MNRKTFFKTLIAIPVVVIAKKFVDVDTVPEKIGTTEMSDKPIPMFYGPFKVKETVGYIPKDYHIPYTYIKPIRKIK